MCRLNAHIQLGEVGLAPAQRGHQAAVLAGRVQGQGQRHARVYAGCSTLPLRAGLGGGMPARPGGHWVRRVLHQGRRVKCRAADRRRMPRTNVPDTHTQQPAAALTCVREAEPAAQAPPAHRAGWTSWQSVAAWWVGCGADSCRRRQRWRRQWWWWRERWDCGCELSQLP